MTIHSATRSIMVEIPEEALGDEPWRPEQLASELLTSWLLEEVRRQRLGFEKAAELAGLPVAHFLERMRESRITPFNLDPQELERELG